MVLEQGAHSGTRLIAAALLNERRTAMAAAIDREATRLDPGQPFYERPRIVRMVSLFRAESFLVAWLLRPALQHPDTRPVLDGPLINRVARYAVGATHYLVDIPSLN